MGKNAKLEITSLEVAPDTGWPKKVSQAHYQMIKKSH